MQYLDLHVLFHSSLAVAYILEYKPSLSTNPLARSLGQVKLGQVKQVKIMKEFVLINIKKI